MKHESLGSKEEFLNTSQLPGVPKGANALTKNGLDYIGPTNPSGNTKFPPKPHINSFYGTANFAE